MLPEVDKYPRTTPLNFGGDPDLDLDSGSGSESTILVTFLGKYSTDLHEIFNRGRSWFQDESTQDLG